MKYSFIDINGEPLNDRFALNDGFNHKFIEREKLQKEESMK